MWSGDSAGSLRCIAPRGLVCWIRPSKNAHSWTKRPRASCWARPDDSCNMQQRQQAISIEIMTAIPIEALPGGLPLVQRSSSSPSRSSPQLSLLKYAPLAPALLPRGSLAATTLMHWHGRDTKGGNEVRPLVLEEERVADLTGARRSLPSPWFEYEPDRPESESRSSNQGG